MRELKRGSIILSGSIIKQWALLVSKPNRRYTIICSSPCLRHTYAIYFVCIKYHTIKMRERNLE